MCFFIELFPFSLSCLTSSFVTPFPFPPLCCLLQLFEHYCYCIIGSIQQCFSLWFISVLLQVDANVEQRKRNFEYFVRNVINYSTRHSPMSLSWLSEHNIVSILCVVNLSSVCSLLANVFVDDVDTIKHLTCFATPYHTPSNCASALPNAGPTKNDLIEFQFMCFTTWDYSFFFLRVYWISKI